jgi:hypothetical protein
MQLCQHRRSVGALHLVTENFKYVTASEMDYGEAMSLNTGLADSSFGMDLHETFTADSTRGFPASIWSRVFLSYSLLSTNTKTKSAEK